MNVVICEDDLSHLKEIERTVIRWREETGRDVLCKTFLSSEELLEQWEKGVAIDLLFLDIQIPGEIDGMSLAKRMRQTDLAMSIVFVTNYTSYVYEGYTVNAMRFLRKPVQREEIRDCLDIAYRQHAILKRDSIAVDARNGQFVLRFCEIVYIEACSHYLRIHLSHTDAQVELRAKLSQFAQRLPGQLFVQCHRGHLINVMHIRKYTNREVTLSSGETLPISSARLPALTAAFYQYYQRNDPHARMDPV